MSAVGLLVSMFFRFDHRVSALHANDLCLITEGTRSVSRSFLLSPYIALYFSTLVLHALLVLQLTLFLSLHIGIYFPEENNLLFSIIKYLVFTGFCVCAYSYLFKSVQKVFI